MWVWAAVEKSEAGADGFAAGAVHESMMRHGWQIICNGRDRDGEHRTNPGLPLWRTRSGASVAVPGFAFRRYRPEAAWGSCFPTQAAMRLRPGWGNRGLWPPMLGRKDKGLIRKDLARVGARQMMDQDKYV